jgi:DNA-binding SARP family transcriptional activator
MSSGGHYADARRPREPPAVDVGLELIRDGDFDGAAWVFSVLLAHGPGQAEDAVTLDSLRQLCVFLGEAERLEEALGVAAGGRRAVASAARSAIDLLAAGLSRDQAPPGTGELTVGLRPPGRVGSLLARAADEDGGRGDAEPPDGPTVGPVRDRSRSPISIRPERDGDDLMDSGGAAIDVRVLGVLEVAIDGRAIAKWGNLKARGVFQYLVLHAGRPVRRDELLETFWSGYSHSSARNNLNVAIYALRQILQTQRIARYVVYSDGCYALDRELSWWIDRNAFLNALDSASGIENEQTRSAAIDRLRAAVALYRGPLFDDDTTSEWHLPEQRALEEAYLRALERVAELELARGAAALAEDAAHRALATDPCRESAHRLLMRCYAEQSQHQLVARQLEICRVAFARRLNASPAPETIELCRALTTRPSPQPRA